MKKINIEDVKNFKKSFNQSDLAIDEDNLTVSFVALSKDNTHERYDMWGDKYFLSVDTSNVRFEANTFYKDHDVSFDNAIGTIEQIKQENGDIKVKVKFNKEVNESYQSFLKYKHGLSNSVSVGFGSDIKLKELEEKEGVKHYEIINGTIEELSAVWKGADKNAVVSKFMKGNEMKKEDVKIDKDKKEDVKVELKEEKQKIDNTVTLAKKDQQDIIQLSKILRCEKEGLDAIEQNMTYREFSKQMATKQQENQKYSSISVIKKEDKQEQDNYSLAKILKNAVNPNIALGVENDYTGKNGGFILPNEFVGKFADNTTKAIEDTGLLGVRHDTNKMIEQLKQESILLDCCTFMENLDTKLSIPKENTNITAEFVEEGAYTETQKLGFDSVSFVPHTLSASVQITRTMLNMSPLSLEQYAYSKIKEAIKRKLEHTILYGDGVVKGLFNIAEITELANYLKAPTFVKTLEFGDILDNAGIDSSNSKFFFRGSDISKLKTTPRGKSLDIMLMDSRNDLQGYNAYKNNMLEVGNCVFGNFEDILIAIFGNLEVRPLAVRGGNIILEGFYDVDMHPARSESFVTSKVSA